MLLFWVSVDPMGKHKNAARRAKKRALALNESDGKDKMVKMETRSMTDTDMAIETEDPRPRY
jgi:hypothetical protein